VPNSQPGILLPKRSRTLTASREAQEIEDRARLMAARLTLARVEKETAAFYETGENPGIGTFSPKIVSIGARVGVRLELVSDIALKRFQAINIVRLCASTRVDYREDDTAVPKLVGNTMHFTSANAKITDYKNDVSRWNEGFANYMAVWGLLFGATHPETVTAMAVFHAYLHHSPTGGLHRRRMHRLCDHKDDAYPRRKGGRPRTLVRDPCRDHVTVLHRDHFKGYSPGRRRREHKKGCPQRLYRDLPELQQVRLRKIQLHASARVFQMWQQIAWGKGLQEVGNGGGQGSSSCTPDPRPHPPQLFCAAATQHRTTIRNFRPSPACA